MTYATFGVFQYILSHQRYAKIKNKPKRVKGTRRKTFSAKKSGSSNSGPAGPATTTLATFSTGGHKAARRKQGNIVVSVL